MKTEEKEDIVFKPKLRIQLLDDRGVTQSDRLVDQYIEFTTGPKVRHDGPIRLEVTLMSQADITGLSQYLETLRSKLPIKEVGTRGRKPINAVTEINSPREEIVAEVEKLIEKGSNQDDIIKYLRSLGFVFLLTEDFLWYFNQFKFKSRDIGEPNSSGQYLESYSWMVRRLKMGKDPKTDKYDPQIIFGFQMIGERTAKFVYYLYKERKKPLSAELPKKTAISFSNTEMTKFPKYMIEEERMRFTTEVRQLLTNDSRKPSKFFLRWVSDVEFPQELKAKVDEALTRK